MLRGYDEGVAEQVSASLMKGDVGPQGKSLGFWLTAVPDTPSLLAIV